MAKIKDLLKELDNALKTGDFDNFFSLLKKNKQLVKARFQDSKITILHHMCSLNISVLKYGMTNFSESAENDEEEYLVSEESLNDAIEKLIDDFGADINAKDNEGNTPLHYAVLADNAPVVDTLLRYSAIVIDKENEQKITPLQMAITKANKEIEQSILKAFNYNISDIQIEEGTGIKEHQRTFKENLIKQGALRAKSIGSQPTIPEAIEAVCYFQNKEQDENFKGKMKELYQNELLQPLMNFMAYHSLHPNIDESKIKSLLKEKSELEVLLQNESDVSISSRITKIEKELKKIFKIFCVDAKDIRNVKPLASEAEGLYNYKNSIFVAASHEFSVERTLGAIFHEATHYVMHILLGNKSNPFPPGEYGNPTRDEFLKIVEDVKLKLESLEKSVKTKSDLENYELIAHVFSSAYTDDQRAKELIVRIPQILASSKNGFDWLKENVPELLKFYMNVINTKINQFLVERDFDKYLAVQPKEEYQTGLKHM